MCYVTLQMFQFLQNCERYNYYPCIKNRDESLENSDLPNFQSQQRIEPPELI